MHALHRQALAEAARASIVNAGFTGRSAGALVSHCADGLAGAEASAPVRGDMPPFGKDEFDAIP